MVLRPGFRADSDIGGAIPRFPQGYTWPTPNLFGWSADPVEHVFGVTCSMPTHRGRCLGAPEHALPAGD